MNDTIIHKSHYFLLDNAALSKRNCETANSPNDLESIKFLSQSILSTSEKELVIDNGTGSAFLLSFFIDSPFVCRLLVITPKSGTVKDLYKDALEKLSIKNNMVEKFSLVYGGFKTGENAVNSIDDAIKNDISMKLRGNGGISAAEYKELAYFYLLADTKGFVCLSRQKFFETNQNYSNIQIILGLFIAYQQMHISARSKLISLLEKTEEIEKHEQHTDLRTLHREVLLFNVKYYSKNPIHSESALISECWQLMCDKKQLDEEHRELSIQMGELMNQAKQRQEQLAKNAADKENEAKKDKQYKNLTILIAVLGLVIAAIQLWHK